MVARLLGVFLLSMLVLPAAKKTVGTARGENEDLILKVSLHLDPADIKELIGSDLEGHYMVAEVNVEPKYGKDVVIDRDDFELRTDKDGEKTRPFVGSQIAGRGSLVISTEDGTVKKSHGWGMGGPIMMGTGATQAKDDKDKPKPAMKNADEDNPLKQVLDAKMLPQKKTEQPAAGLLYFPMEKQKLKDLELVYGGKENRITLRFK